MFRDVTPCILVESTYYNLQSRGTRHVRNQQELLLAATFYLTACLKIRVCEMFVNFCQTTQYHIQEDNTLHNHRRENL
jgi:hypothetical protein